MGIDFKKTFGADSAPITGSTSTTKGSDAPKAKFWLNVGYVAVGAAEDGSDRFVSLPVGIPLDTQEKVATSSRNESYAEFQAARNDLLDQIMEVAQGLKPGEDTIINLQLQLRRTQEEKAPVAMTEGNRFARPAGVSLVG